MTREGSSHWLEILTRMGRESPTYGLLSIQVLIRLIGPGKGVHLGRFTAQYSLNTTIPRLRILLVYRPSPCDRHQL